MYINHSRGIISAVLKYQDLNSVVSTTVQIKRGRVLSAFAENHGRKPVDECEVRTRRSSKSEGGLYASADSAEENEETMGVSPWSFIYIISFCGNLVVFFFAFWGYSKNMPQEQKTILSQEEEIQGFRRRLEEKKLEAQERGEEAREEKEIFREVLKEYIEKGKTQISHTPSGISHLPSPGVKQADQTKKDEEREEEIRRLVEIALSKTIQEAIREAGAESPYLLDELHDHLVDDFYEKLVALRKIKEY